MENTKNAVHSFLCTNRMHHRVADKAVSSAGIDLHRSQHMLLMHLGKEGGSYSQKELAEHLNISPAALAVKIKKLESEGYIVRTKAPDDCRTNTVKITPKGSAVLKTTRTLFESIDTNMVKGITPSELAVFVNCLKKMYGNLETIYKNPEILKEEAK